MSGRLLASGALPLARRVAQVRQYHRFPTGGLTNTNGLRATRRQAFHNAVVVRNASFARFLPKLVLKFVRIPAMFGGLMIGGVAWIQYQAIQVSNSAADMYKSMKSQITDGAVSFWDSAKEVAGQTRRGWDNTKEEVELPEWLQKVLRIHEDIGSGSGGGSGGQEPPKQAARAAAAGGMSAAAYGYEQSSEDDDRTNEEIARDDQMMMLTKKMIEIRGILQQVGQSSSLNLPSIVVIGSQSSGKSSVLEAIVGHEFLPKGSNMVTRRPIELTLINTPDSQVEYGEFPDLGLRKVTDFSSIQRTLTDLNLAVPDTECVSDDPIRLSVYSPNVPDLSLIDLPGYIQVVGHNQPLELKQKISDLCDKYIQSPNVILAISAADVDLANSTALRASRRVDPAGERTIGVVTKMDLVDPVRGMAILTDKQYPLRLGYVGVVSRAPPVTGLFKKGTGSNLMSTITKNENSFFSAHPLEYGPGSDVSVGTTTLRKKLMHVLEGAMSSSLVTVSRDIQRELQQTSYDFQVKYHGRPLSAESYLAECLDGFKHVFKEFTVGFSETHMRELIRDELDQRVLDLLAQRYWNKPIPDLRPAPPEVFILANPPKTAAEVSSWQNQLDISTAALTNLFVGRLATTVVQNNIESRLRLLVHQSPFAEHPYTMKAMEEAIWGTLGGRFDSTSDQVDIYIKPIKVKAKLDEREWKEGRDNIARVLKNELVACQDAMRRLEDSVGGKRKLKDVMSFVDKAKKGDVRVEGDPRLGAGGFDANLLERGRQAVFLRDRADIINMRMLAVKSKQCKSLENKHSCPEVFLDAVAGKMATQAASFLDAELWTEFLYRFPRQLDERLGRHLPVEHLEAFAKVNPEIRDHLETIRRKELLEVVLEKMEGLRHLENSRDRSRSKPAKEKKQGWGLF